MRLIDEREWEKLYNELTKDLKPYDHYDSGFEDAVDRIDDWMDVQPTVEADPVVRCKDCRYWQDNNGGYPHEECRWCKDETPDADDFCSYGERKADNA